jgi:transposase
VAEENALKPILSFVKIVKNHVEEIANSMKSLINNTLSEGLNSVFQLSKHQSRGYRNVDNFIAMVYFLGNTLNFLSSNNDE